MITLRLDKNGGINKGDVQAFEHDNLSEVYIIQLYKNGAIYDLTNKTIELTMVERKRKIGDMVSLPIYNATEGKVKLEVVSDITKQDGIYDFKLTVKDTTGLIETFPSFQVKIENDITDHITGEIVQDKNFTILTEGLKALADYNIYKTNALKVPEIEQDIVEINEQLDTIIRKTTLNQIANRFFGHRGVDYAPENTFASFNLAKQMGFKGIETDIVFTSDNVPIILHDSTVDRTTNGTGSASAMTLEQIKALTIDYGTNITLFPNEKIPTLDEFLQWIKSNDMTAILEIKVNINAEKAKIIYDLIVKYNLINKVIISGFEVANLSCIRQLDDNIALCLALNYGITDEDLLKMKQQIKINYCVMPYHSRVTTETVIKAHSENVPIIAWDVQNIANAQNVVSLGVDYILSDYINEVIYDGTL